MKTFTPTLTKLSFAAVVAIGALTGCASQSTQSYPSSSYPASSSISSSYGRVETIEVVRGNAGSNTSGAGAIVGGLVGGLLGNQVGGGTGRTAATVAGAVGGAVVGNNVERNKQAGDMYQVGVRLENGAYMTVTQDSVADLRVGDRVSVQNNRVYRN